MGVPADFTMTARKIGQSRHIVLGTASHFEVRGEPSTPAELQQHRAVVYAQKGGGARWTFRHGATEDTVTLRASALLRRKACARRASQGLVCVWRPSGCFSPISTTARSGKRCEIGSCRGSMFGLASQQAGASAKGRAFAVFVENKLRQTHFAP
jgi:hypothetical protein